MLPWTFIVTLRKKRSSNHVRAQELIHQDQRHSCNFSTFFLSSSFLFFTITGAPFKEGVLNQQETHSLARKLKTWKRIGRALQLDDATLNEIDEDINGLVEKGHAMLRRWMEVNGSAATYQKLAEGLEIAKRRDLIRTFCCERIWYDLCYLFNLVHQKWHRLTNVSSLRRCLAKVTSTF